MVSLASLAWARPAAVGFVDSAEGHVRCQYADPADAARCGEVVAWAEEAWAVEVDRIGFHAWLPDNGLGGSDALDLYLTRRAGGAGSAWVDCDGGDPDCLDPDPTDDVAQAPSYVVIDPRTAEADFRHYVHHELCHVPQYASDYTEPYLDLWEATAVACEHWVDPSWPTIAKDLGDFQATPWVSTILQDGYFLADLGVTDASWYEYGAVAWMFWLDEAYGDGRGSVGPALWAAAARPGADVLDAWDEVTGDWRAAILEFTAVRARMGLPEGPAWSAFAGDLARAAREPTPVDAPAAPAFAPYPLGVVFYDAEGPFDLAFEGDPAVEWAVLVVDGDGASELGGGGSVSAAGPVTLAVVNLGPPGFDPDGSPLQPASFTLRVSPPEGGAPRAVLAGGGCGCAAGSAGGWVSALGALGLARRRRTPRVAVSG